MLESSKKSAKFLTIFTDVGTSQELFMTRIEWFPNGSDTRNINQDVVTYSFLITENHTAKNQKLVPPIFYSISLPRSMFITPWFNDCNINFISLMHRMNFTNVHAL